MKDRTRKIILGWVVIISAGFFGHWIGTKDAAQTPATSVSNEAYEEKFKEELNSIYNLLSAMMMTERLNMNLSLKTNHYLEHDFSGDICVDCIKHYQNLVAKMPELPERDQIWFDRFYKHPLDRVLEENPEILNKIESEK